MNVQLSLSDSPIAIKDYTTYKSVNLPKVVLGLRIKNKFDEDRTIIKSKYSPKNVLHFKWTSQLEPTFLHGIEINVKKQYQPLLQLLKTNNIFLQSDTYNQCRDGYRKILTEYNLSCDDCYGYFADGLYPIDLKHLSKISKKSYSAELQTGLSSLLKQTKYPWYCSLPNFNLFILTWCSSYNFDYYTNEINNKEL